MTTPLKKSTEPKPKKSLNLPTFREFKSAEWEECEDLMARTFNRDDHPLLKHVNIREQFGMMVSEMRDNTPPTLVYVLEDNGKIVALGALAPTFLGVGSFIIGAVAVDTDVQKKGYGATLVKSLEGVAQNINKNAGIPICNVYLACFDSSFEFWKKQGYVEYQPKDGMGQHIMMKSLY